MKIKEIKKYENEWLFLYAKFCQNIATNYEAF